MEFADKYFDVLNFISRNVVSNIFLPVLLIIIIKVSTNKDIVSTALKVIRWVIISYCIISLIGWLFIFILPTTESYAFIDRAIGSYAWAYWLMLFFNSMFPLILLIKKLGENIFVILLISILMNFGWLFERFVIIITSIHRDYVP